MNIVFKKRCDNISVHDVEPGAIVIAHENVYMLIENYDEKKNVYVRKFVDISNACIHDKAVIDHARQVEATLTIGN
jgi:hypothetical protein